MQRLQAELKAANPGWNTEIIGVNQISASSDNTIATAGRTLPWLQDTAIDKVWEKWKVTYRDVWVLDAGNRLFGVYNLTTQDLGVEANYLALKKMFLDAAKVVDSDRDGLPDEWELKYFGGIESNPGDDPEADQITNLSEFALGLHPQKRDASAIKTSIIKAAGQSRLRINFLRRAGGTVNYQLELSPDLQQWSAAGDGISVPSSPRNLFDGTGTIEMSYTLNQDLSSGLRFVRLRALAP